MTITVRRKAGTPLSEEAREQLRKLAEMPDEDIDFSDIPERPFNAVRSTRKQRQAVIVSPLEKAG
jgi:hypothetical protein